MVSFGASTPGRLAVWTSALTRPGMWGLSKPRWDAVAKRSIRAAVVIPGLFAFADKVLKNAQIATFASIGAFSVLLLADFGGPLRRRLIAYTGLAVVGAVFITIATLSSRVTWLAVVVAGLAAALVLFLGILSGYVAKGIDRGHARAHPSPHAPRDTPVRSGLGLRAGHSRRSSERCRSSSCGAIRRRPASARWPATRCTGSPTTCAPPSTARPSRRTRQVAEQAVAKLNGAYLATPFRPTGATLSEQAIVQLVEEIDWLLSPHGEARRPARRRLRARDVNGSRAADAVDRRSP